MRSFSGVTPWTVVAALGLCAAPAIGSEGQVVRVTASALNVRTFDENRLCAVPRNTQLTVIGRNAEGTRVKVRVNHPGCPGEGWVYVNYVLPSARAEVDASSLSLRAGPSASRRWICGLPRGTDVEVTDDTRNPGWFQVRLPNPPPGCPSEGYVHGSYLKPESGFFSSLPVTEGAIPRMENTEAGAGLCETGDCSNPSPPGNGNIEDLRQIAAAAGGAQGQFLTELRRMIANPNYRSPHYPRGRDGMIQYPISGRLGKAGPCGSARYNPDELMPGRSRWGRGSDTWINPTTACAFTAALQEWKRTACPDSTQGCRVAWGDISLNRAAQWDGHRTHTMGYCIDVRPLRSGGFQDAPITHRSRGYSRDRTRQMIETFKRFGGTGYRNNENPYFNDTACGTRSMGGHDNHIHVCFNPNNPAVQGACNNLTIDPNICPELQ